MKWKIAQAKKSFSEMIHRARKEPQFIYNRDSIVAVIINPEEYDEYQEFRENRNHSSLATAFDELRGICEKEDYTLALPARKDRKVVFP